MKMRLPNLNGFGTATKSSSFKNLDSVTSAITFLVNYSGIKSVAAFMTALTTSYQRVTYMVSVNPTLTIAELKRIRLAYITWIRGGPPVPLSPESAEEEPEHVVVGDKSEGSSAGLSFAAEEYLLGTLCIKSLIELRNSLTNPKPSEEVLWFFDVIVIAFLDINRVINMPAVWSFESVVAGPASTYFSEVEGESRAIAHNKEALKAGSGAKPLPVPKITHSLSEHLPSLLPALGWSAERVRQLYKNKCRSQKFYIINSSGPNGEATWTAYSDAIALLRNRAVIQAMNSFCVASGLKRFMKKLVRVVQLRAVDAVPIESLKLGKLITFAEWGGKTRTVASVDYWTQIILTPLHDTLFEILKSIEMDATFDQRAAAETIRQWSRSKNAELYSFDLTAATDRLPRTLQASVLNTIFTKTELGTHWVNMLSLREYYSEDGNNYIYGCGLPMGSKSNWAMLAFTHHLIVQRAAQLANVKEFTNYRICGDDIVINSTAVAKNYRAIMEYYGLKINESKSILHIAGCMPAAEFCKRIFINGNEYTCLPTKLIAKTVMNGRLLPQLQNEVIIRNFKLSGTQLFVWLGALVDSQSHSFLALLNKLPNSITGMVEKLELPIETPELESFWAPYHELSENDMVQGYTYVAATEQLKRLDALLRQTKLVNDAIAAAMASNYNLNLNMFEWTQEVEHTALATTLKQYMTDLSPAHPIVEAAQAEAIRVSLLLTKLSNGDMTVETAARLEVLDMFRNSLTSMWQDQEAARAQADRTLIIKVLDVLENMLGSLNEHSTPEQIAAAKTVTFSTKLTHLERNWVVRWPLGSNMNINTMKSRVETSSTAASNNATSNASVLPIRRSNRS